jgi:hypothetical protein
MRKVWIAIATASVSLLHYSAAQPFDGDRSDRVEAVLAELAAPAPTIASIAPDSGPVGTLVTLQGSNFTASNTVDLTGNGRSFRLDSPARSETGSRLQFRISTCPSYAPLCPTAFTISPGVYDVSVTNSHGTSNRVRFSVTLP